MENIDYLKSLRTFESLVKNAITVSDASGSISTSTIGIESTKIFTRIVLASMTINKILPLNKVNGNPLWDFASIAVLSRSYLETCHRFFYLSELGLGQEEIDFRLKIYFYRNNKEKYLLYKESGAAQEVLEGFEANLPSDLKEITDSSIFQSLPDYRQKAIKKGELDMHYSDKELSEKLNLLGKHYKPIYRLFSNHAHGSPFATISQSNERGRGLRNETEEFYLALCLEFLNHYLSYSIMRQIEFFPLPLKSELDLAKGIFTKDD